MAGGSREAESDEDQQCQHCGLWFGSAGILNHEAHCDLAGFERRLQSLSCPFAVMRADDVELSEDAPGDAPEGAPEGDVDDVEEPEPVDEIAAEPEPSSPGDPTDRARTDGGPKEVPMFDDSDAGADDVEEPEATTCPACGGTAIEDPEAELPEEALRQTPAIRGFDHICMDCSTDASGTWTNPVEVFNA